MTFNVGANAYIAPRPWNIFQKDWRQTIENDFKAGIEDSRCGVNRDLYSICIQYWNYLQHVPENPCHFPWQELIEIFGADIICP